MGVVHEATHATAIAGNWGLGEPGSEIYTVRADPGETRNIAAEQPALVERAR
jgi:hypothetical protein